MQPFRPTASPDACSAQPAVTPLTAPSITTSWTVNDVIRYFPMTVLVFNDLGIDSCCGGMATVEAAARVASVTPAHLLAAIQASVVEEKDNAAVSWTNRLIRKIR